MNADKRLLTALACGNIWQQTDIPECVGTRRLRPPLSGLPPPGLWEPSCPSQSKWAQLMPTKLSYFSWESPGRRKEGHLAGGGGCSQHSMAQMRHIWGYSTTVSLAPEDHTTLPLAGSLCKILLFMQVFRILEDILKYFWTCPFPGKCTAKPGQVANSELTEQPVESTPGSEAAKGKELLAGFNRLPPTEIFKKRKTPQQ